MQFAVSFAIALSAAAFFLVRLDLREFLNALMNGSLWWLIVGIASFMTYQFFRTWRFYLLLLSKQGHFGTLYAVQCLHGFLNSILPAGLGEAAFVYLLKRLYRIPYTEGSVTLVVARTQDIVLFALLFVCLYAGSWRLIEQVEGLRHVLLLMVCLSVLLLGAICFLVAGGERHRKTVSRWLGTALLRRWSFSRRVEETVHGLLLDLERVFSLRRLTLSGAFTSLMWLSMYMVFYSAIQALRYPLSWGEVMLIFLILWPFSLLPVKGLGNFGTHEAGWILGLMLLGYGESDAIILALGTHLVFILNVLVLTLFPLLFFVWKRKSMMKEGAASRERVRMQE